MKIQLVLAFCILHSLHSHSQEVLATANKCYDAKDYNCAIDNYKKAIAEKKFQAKDHPSILFRIGFAYESLKKNSEAVTYFKEAIAIKPDYGSAYWSVAGNYYVLKNFEGALEYYNKAIELMKSDKANLKNLYYWRGKTYASLGKHSDALTSLQLAIKEDSTVANFYASAGDAYFNSKDYPNAIKNYQRSIQLGTSDRKVQAARYYWLGESYLEMKNYAEALIAYKGTLEYDPEHKNVTWSTAGAYYNLEKWPDAITYYTRALQVYKDTLSLKDLYYYRGRSYYMSKDYVKAISDYDAALKLDPNDKGAVWQKANALSGQKKYKEAIPLFERAIVLYEDEESSLDDIYYFKGFAHLQSKDTVKARADFIKSISYNSNLIDPNYQMGNISFAHKKYYEAKDYYGKSFTLKTDSATLSQLYFRKGYSNLVLGSSYFYSAKSDLQKSIALDSNNKEAHRYLADAYYMEKSFNLTEKELKKCLVLYKNVKDSLPNIHMYLGMAYSQMKKYKEALESYETADKLKKFTDPAYISSMGQLAFEIKEYDKTIALFTRVIPMYKPAQTNELVFAYFGRGRAYLEKKKKKEAVKDLQKALELAPGNKEIEVWLAKANQLQ